jgi:hypothetical protein
MLALQSALGNQALQRAVRKERGAPAGAVLQRHCACGGDVAESGECDGCRGRRLEGAPAADVSISEAGPDDEGSDTELEVYSDSGSTSCDVETGRTTTRNTNRTCSRPCTQAHEDTHVRDVSGCCAEASRAFKGASDQASKDRIKAAMRNWMKGQNNAALECRAYAAGVACNDAMYDRKKCGTPEMAKADAACCKDLPSFRSAWERQRMTFCGASGGAAPGPCPFPEPIEPSVMEEDLEDQPWRSPFGPPPIF